MCVGMGVYHEDQCRLHHISVLMSLSLSLPLSLSLSLSTYVSCVCLVPQLAALTLHYYERARYQGYKYDTSKSTVAITANHKTRYGKLNGIIVVEAEPTPMQILMVRGLKTKLITLGASQFCLPRLDCQGSAVASVHKAQAGLDNPICVQYHAIWLVNTSLVTLDSMAIVDV